MVFHLLWLLWLCCQRANWLKNAPEYKCDACKFKAHPWCVGVTAPFPMRTVE